MLPRIAYISSYPPRRCGIATFAQDLVQAVGSGEVFAVDKQEDSFLYPPEVAARIDCRDAGAYRRAALRLNRGGFDAVSIQHEYGIFGGPDGAHLLELTDNLTVPSVVTLHSVLRRPSQSQRDVLTRLARKSSAVVVMSHGSADLLWSVYGIPPERIRVIHHGTPDLPATDTWGVRDELGLAGRTVILSFGLLGPGKGYANMIRAMAGLTRDHPEALYVVLGATHPEVVRSQGEQYRQGLEAIVDELGLGDHVRFVDKFVTQAELGRWLTAADIFTTPYPNLDQAVSGTLAYAVAAGKAIVSTPYAYAKELLADGRGLIVEPDSVAALEAALNSLVGDRRIRETVSHNAYQFGRRMVWPNVGREYRALFAEVARPARAAVARGVTIPIQSDRPIPIHAGRTTAAIAAALAAARSSAATATPMQLSATEPRGT